MHEVTSGIIHRSKEFDHLSAKASSLSRAVRQNVSAVTRLMTKSNLVGISVAAKIEQYDQVLCNVRSIRHEFRPDTSSGHND